MTLKHGTLLAAILLTTTVSAAVAFNTTSSGTEKPSAKPTEATAAAQPAEPGTEVEPSFTKTLQAGSEEEDLRVLLVAIRPSGFEPKEITLPAGDYLVVVRNRSGSDEFDLRLERNTGQILREVPARRFKRDWKQILQLTPGNYVIRETNHPDWICRITITPR